MFFVCRHMRPGQVVSLRRIARYGPRRHTEGALRRTEGWLRGRYEDFCSDEFLISLLKFNTHVHNMFIEINAWLYWAYTISIHFMLIYCFVKSCAIMANDAQCLVMANEGEWCLVMSYAGWQSFIIDNFQQHQQQHTAIWDGSASQKVSWTTQWRLVSSCLFVSWGC